MSPHMKQRAGKAPASSIRSSPDFSGALGEHPGVVPGCALATSCSKARASLLVTRLTRTSLRTSPSSIPASRWSAVAGCVCLGHGAAPHTPEASWTSCVPRPGVRTRPQTASMPHRCCRDDIDATSLLFAEGAGGSTARSPSRRRRRGSLAPSASRSRCPRPAHWRESCHARPGCRCRRPRR